jgi:hypothetical protein
MSGQIFISYRREESRWSARSLHDRLCRNFDPEQIFMDIDAIALGEDFVKAIETTVAKCDVLIAVIGERWLTSADKGGFRENIGCKAGAGGCDVRPWATRSGQIFRRAHESGRSAAPKDF